MNIGGTLALLGAVALAAGGCNKKDEAAKGGGQAAETDKAGTGAAADQGGNARKGDSAAAEATAKKKALIERGEYVAKLAGCQFCHTPFGPQGPDMSKTWAGGLEVAESIGTWRSPNITQDEKTGIGGWTDEQIKTAIRQGKRPDGSQLYPIMPYMLYNKMSHQDADALVAYLRTIEPIEHEVKPTEELKIPKIPAPEPSVQAAPSPSDTVAHGEYLATLMHCVQCHTPLDKATGGFDMKRAFAGGFPIEVPQLGEGVLYSTNLTPHETGIKDYSDQEIIDAIRMMKKKDGSIIQGPMALYQGSWYDLPDKDAAAIAAFLRTLPPVDNKVPASTFKPRNPPPPAQ